MNDMLGIEFGVGNESRDRREEEGDRSHLGDRCPGKAKGPNLSARPFR